MNPLKIVEVLGQRRVWSMIVGGIAFVVTSLNIGFHVDVPVLTDLLTQLGLAIVTLVQGGLALWSYLKPKAKPNNI